VGIMTRIGTGVALLASVMAGTGPVGVLAQDGNVGSELVAAPSNRVVYDQAYFAAHEVQNAEHMLRRVPK
jgi:hypothetical protein